MEQLGRIVSVGLVVGLVVVPAYGAEPKQDVEAAKDKAEAVARDMRFEIDRHKDFVRDAKKRTNEAKAHSLAMKRTYGKCPSPDAQADYDRAKAHLEALERLKKDAVAQYEALKPLCIDRIVAPKSVCQPAVQMATAAVGLPVAPIEAARDLVETLRGMKCLAGCDKQARAVVPVITGPASGPVVGAPPAAGAKRATVCAQWETGVFTANVDMGTGELSADTRARIPRCAKVEEVSLCNSVDVNGAFFALKATGMFPPGVDPSLVKVIFPTRSVDVVTDIRIPDACSKATLACGGGSKEVFPLTEAAIVTKSASLGEMLSRYVKGCENVASACTSPPFGLEVKVKTLEIADPRAATVAWAGVDVKPGNAGADFTKPNLAKFCNGFTDASSLFPPPRLVVGKKSIETPMCERPRFENVVAKP